MAQVGYGPKPKVLGVYFANQTSSSYLNAQILPTYIQRRLTHNVVPVSITAVRQQLHLEASDDYEFALQEPFEDDVCKAKYEWMHMAFPTCNSIHETDLSDLKAKNEHQMKVSIMSSGYWRDVWKIQNGLTERVVLKTLRNQHDFDERNYDRHRRDAVATDRLKRSPNIIDIYGFCGNTAVYEFVPGAFAHTDITPAQFVHVDGIYKLSDFNRCRFIPFDEKRQRNCGFRVPNNPGAFRAPEEYAYELENEKVDIYSMGNVFYVLLTRQWPFDKEEDEEAQNKVEHGERPEIPRAVRDSKDSSDKALLKLTKMCWEQDPRKRPAALEVKDYIAAELKKVGINN
ncbi:protein tyrosine kinase [Fragilaria crotonensis]|nr:protein tyrosine kinase [Fragilaria crotonensis]